MGYGTGRKPADAPLATPVQAARGEHWWPVALAISAIKPWAKLLMIIEAAVSAVIGALVIARAINILA